MSAVAVPTLPELLEHPDRALEVDPRSARKFVMKLTVLMTSLLIPAISGGGVESEPADSDVEISKTEAGKLIHRSSKWVKIHEHELPFVLPNGRCSLRKVERYVRERGIKPRIAKGAA